MSADKTQAVTEAVANAESAVVDVIYLMGFSFILGSIFTIVILMLLDFMQRNRKTKE